MEVADTPWFNPLCDLITEIYGPSPVLLHRPVFVGNEKDYLIDCIDSNFVSSVGAKVIEFEQQVAAFSGTSYGVAVANGTAALHAALLLVGVKPGDEVISQALTFIATCNAITYANATPVFVDVDRDTMGMSPLALRAWLESATIRRDGACYNKRTGARISACVPMHTFGNPCRIAEIARICEEFSIPLIEDAAESLGSFVEGVHTGNFGRIATLSFNGNKTITTGGGGMIITSDKDLAVKAKHLTTTAKVPHAWEFAHDMTGYNYRMPNLNAALGCAQMEVLPSMLAIKQEVTDRYDAFCLEHGLQFVRPITGATSNNWLNAIILDSLEQRDAFLKTTNAMGLMTRPIWQLMTRLEMFKNCERDSLEHSIWLEERVVNIPSSVPDRDIHRVTQ